MRGEIWLAFKTPFYQFVIRHNKLGVLVMGVGLAKAWAQQFRTQNYGLSECTNVRYMYLSALTPQPRFAMCCTVHQVSRMGTAEVARFQTCIAISLKPETRQPTAAAMIMPLSLWRQCVLDSQYVSAQENLPTNLIIKAHIHVYQYLCLLSQTMLFII